MIQKTVGSLILDYFQFELLISKANCLLNKRVIAFKSSLRSLPMDELPEVITPEKLIKGYETCVLNIIPDLQGVPDDDPTVDFSSHSNIKTQYDNLIKAKDRLVELYHNEFLAGLIHQAVDKDDRYKPVKHDLIGKGDIVLLVEKNRL